MKMNYKNNYVPTYYKNNDILVKIFDLFYIILLGFFLFKRFFEITKWMQTYKWSEILFNKINIIYNSVYEYILLSYTIIKIILYKKKLYKISLFLLLIVIAKISGVASGNNYIFIVFLLMISAMNINYKKILYLSLVINLSILIPTIFAAKYGLLPNTIEVGRNREYLGFIWTTLPVMIYCYTCFSFINLKNGKISMFEYVLINLINIWFFIKTDTRFAFLILLMTSTFFFLLGNKINFLATQKIIPALLLIFPWIASFCVYFFSSIYDENNKILFKVNKLLSNRLEYCNYSIKKYGVKLFGQSITWSGRRIGDEPINYVDSAYLQYLLQYGLFILIILLVICSIIIYQSNNKKNFVLMFSFAFVMVFGITEQQMFWIEYDVLLLLAFSDITNYNKQNKLFIYENIYK